jgi:hypothetical protein
MDRQLEDILEQCKRTPEFSLKEISSLQKLLTEAIKICKHVTVSYSPPPITCDPDIEPMDVD